MSADQDFLERLDAAIGCQHCENPLPEDAVSDYFCSEFCSLQYADQRAPSGRTYDYFENVDDYGRGWSADDLTDLEPVSWIAPPPWRLPRSTADLEADQRALERAEIAAVTGPQLRACAYRRQSLAERRRALWARNWRLPRSTGNYRHDQAAFAEADRTATTDTQRAACALRLESLAERRKALPKPEYPGRSTLRGIDRYTFPTPAGPDLDPSSPTYVHGPYGFGPGWMSRAEARQAAMGDWNFDLTSSPLVHSRISWNPSSHERSVVDSEFNARGTFDSDCDDAPFGSQAQNNLPGIRPSTIEMRGFCSPRSPNLREGDTVVISTSSITGRYLVEGYNPNGSMRCRRIPDDQPTQGVEATEAIIDETSPQARALEARRNRNTGPAPRPGRVRGNVPGARR